MPYVLHRIAFGLFLLGFSMIPAMYALHFWGLAAGVVVAGFLPSVAAVRLTRRIWASWGSTEPYLTSNCPLGWQLHPALTLAAGAVFILGGLWIFTLTPGVPRTADTQMTPLERYWFGTMFVLWGSGIQIAALSLWLSTYRRETKRDNSD